MLYPTFNVDPTTPTCTATFKKKTYSGNFTNDSHTIVWNDGEQWTKVNSRHLAMKTPSKEATTTDNEPPTTGHAGKHNTKTQCITNTTASEPANEQTIFADQVSSI